MGWRKEEKMSVFARRLMTVSAASGGPSGSSGSLLAPDYVTATGGDGQATLWWTTVAKATGYDVEYRVSPSGAWTSFPHTSTLTHAVVTGLTNGIVYDLRVRSTNATEQSQWTVAPQTITPAAATNTGSGLPTTLETVLVNQASTDTLYAYVIGLDLNNGRWTLVTADGQSTYQPPTPGADHTPLAQDCAIALNANGAPGVSIQIPRLASGRIFFSYDQKLQFFMNSDGGFVMPSEKDVNDPNIDIQWTFSEFTFNNAELYGNISFVDILSIPLAFELETSDGSGMQYVPGLPDGAMLRVASELTAQKVADGGDWDKCIFRDSANNIVRILSPNAAAQIYPTAFANYLDPYIDAVWQKYTNEDLIVNTQRVEWGIATGRVSGNILDFGGGTTFAKPSTQSVWSCSIPPWTTGNDEQGNITARLTAAFNRTTLLINSNQPNGENPETYYQNALTNHYSRIVHEQVYGNLGYAFPYDDVHPDGGISYEGRIQSSSPLKWTITIGMVGEGLPD